MELTRKEHRKMKRNTFNYWFMVRTFDLAMKGFMNLLMFVGALFGLASLLIGMLYIVNVMMPALLGW